LLLLDTKSTREREEWNSEFFPKAAGGIFVWEIASWSCRLLFRT
jgi:hypothetical protein